ncbi:hypothetical protein ACCT19_29240, partial [Rhizobium ruizarguesonis]
MENVLRYIQSDSRYFLHDTTPQVGEQRRGFCRLFHVDGKRVRRPLIEDLVPAGGGRTTASCGMLLVRGCAKPLINCRFMSWTTYAKVQHRAASSIGKQPPSVFASNFHLIPS